MGFMGENSKYLFGSYLLEKQWIRNLLMLFLSHNENKTNNSTLRTRINCLNYPEGVFNDKNIKDGKKGELFLRQFSNLSNSTKFWDNNCQNHNHLIGKRIKSHFWRTVSDNIGANSDFSKPKSENNDLLELLLNEKTTIKNFVLNYVNLIIENIKLNRKYGNLFGIIFNSNCNAGKTTSKEKIFDAIDLLILDCPNMDCILNLTNSLKWSDSSFTENIYVKYLLSEVTSRLFNHNSDFNITELKNIIYKTCILSCEMYNNLMLKNGVTNIKKHFDSFKQYNVDHSNVVKLKLRFYIGFIVNSLIYGSNKGSSSDFVSLIDDLVDVISNNNNMSNYNEYKLFVEIIAMLLSKADLDAGSISKLILLVNKLQKIHYNPELMGCILNNILSNEFIIQYISRDGCNKYYNEICRILFQYINSNNNNKQNIQVIRNIIKNKALPFHYFNNETSINKFVDVIMDIIVKNVFDKWSLNARYENENGFESDLLLKLANLNFGEKNRTSIMNCYFSTLNSLLNYVNEFENNGIDMTKLKLSDKINSTDNNFNYNLLKKCSKALGKTNNLNFFRKMNGLFLKYNNNDTLNNNVLSNLINYFDLNTFVQKILEHNLSNDIDWLLVSEGINLINNCISFNFDNNITTNVEKLDNALKLADNIVKILKNSFDNIKSMQNNNFKKINIPNSKVYFEILRFIHNLNFVKKNSNEEIKLIPQGLVPLNTISVDNSREDPDFINGYVNDMLVSKCESVIAKSNLKPLNLVFIHGFLGSAFKSWNLDTSNKKVSVITDNHRHYLNPKYNKKLVDLDALDELKVSENNKKILNCLENSNYLLWPKILLLNDSNSRIRLFAVDYSHNIFNNGSNSELNSNYCNKATLNKISEEIYNRLKKANVFSKKDNIIICHSMGGILLKLMITNHPELTKKIKGIIFFGTPHFGTNIHSLLVDIFKKRLSPYIIELSSSFNINQLKNLNSRFQRIIYSMPKEKRPQIYSFSEYLPSKIPFLFNLSKVIVPYLNSNPFIGHFYILGTDHNKINKLTLNDNDVRYKAIKYLINS
ncbi:hypothetical protein FG379_002976 [Cryptosporidium bovis]|uniref:uncharacterized protein n=1 Tax=Cryptosporidium bovis TaxID=310047 RepID=UPI00351A55F4|nr:hypothetical protein FG379_002976 [Cryptosporidium bovis]